MTRDYHLVTRANQGLNRRVDGLGGAERYGDLAGRIHGHAIHTPQFAGDLFEQRSGVPRRLRSALDLRGQAAATDVFQGEIGQAIVLVEDGIECLPDRGAGDRDLRLAAGSVIARWP